MTKKIFSDGFGHFLAIFMAAQDLTGLGDLSGLVYGSCPKDNTKNIKMKKQVISKAGDWSQWTPELKEALEASKNNTQVGEKIVFENSEFRVWSIHLPAGQSLPFHKHGNRYFWTAMSIGKSRSYYNDGSIVDTEYELGDTSYFGDLNKESFFIHNLENIGDTMLIYTTVEFLK